MQKLMRNARAELRASQARLRAEIETLKTLHASLPVSPQEEAMLEGEVETDFSTEARAVIECVISDRLEPAIGALAEVAETRRKPGRPKGAAARRP